MVAYPDSIFNDAYLLNQSAAANMSRGDNMYFNTFKNFRLLSIRKNFQQLGKPVNRSRSVELHMYMVAHRQFILTSPIYVAVNFCVVLFLHIIIPYTGFNSWSANFREFHE